MGSWTAYDSENIDEADNGGAGNGDGTAEINLNPGEKAQVDVERTDAAAAGDDWLIAVQATVEDSPDYADDPPIRAIRMKGTQTKKSLLIAGLYGFRIWVQNDDTDTDVVAATVGWRKDGVSI
jgi:hypothetical protein